MEAILLTHTFSSEKGIFFEGRPSPIMVSQPSGTRKRVLARFPILAYASFHLRTDVINDLVLIAGQNCRKTISHIFNSSSKVDSTKSRNSTLCPII